MKNPIELSLRTNKTLKAIQSLAYRYEREIDLLPTTKSGVKAIEREVKARLRKERLGEEAEAYQPMDLEEAKNKIVKDPAYYMVMTLAYKRVVEHADKLLTTYKGDEGLIQLRKDMEHAASITEAKALAKSSDLEELVT